MDINNPIDRAELQLAAVKEQLAHAKKADAEKRKKEDDAKKVLQEFEEAKKKRALEQDGSSDEGNSYDESEDADADEVRSIIDVMTFVVGKEPPGIKTVYRDFGKRPQNWEEIVAMFKTTSYLSSFLQSAPTRCKSAM